MAFEGAAEVYDESMDGVCRKAGQFGPDHVYYKGYNFDHVKYGRGPSGGPVGSCVAEVGTYSPSTPLYEVCSTFEVVNGVKTRISKAYSWLGCEKPCDHCAEHVGNPVDIASFAKVVKAVDWASPIEPRFRIERNYRSDSVFRTRHSGLERSDQDLFANIWQQTFNDVMSSGGANPYDPADTRSWPRFSQADGRDVYFLQGDTTQMLGAIGWSRSGGLQSSSVTSPDGVRRNFALGWIQSIVWPDGYRITVDGGGRYPTGLTDNKGNRVVYVFNQNVVPGANRKLISEIIIQRLSGASYVETGRLIYGYTALSYPALGKNGNSDSSVTPFVDSIRPALTSVDYLASGSTNPTVVWRYTYATSLPSLPPNPDGSLPRVQDNVVTIPLLTSISDGGAVPYAEYTYKDYGTDPSGRYLGFGVATEKYAGDAQPTVFDRNPDGSIHTLTNPLGHTTSYGFAEAEWNKKVASISGEGTANTLPTTTALTRGTGEVVTESVQRNGSTTTYTRDARGRILTMTEDALGLNPRTTSYTWHATLRLPLTRTTQGLLETFTYDSAGLLLTYTQQDTKPGSPTLNQTRTWTYGYTTLANGLKVLTTLNGPGLPADGITDVTTYTYTATGDLITATDPAGLVTTVLARNTFGQPTLVEQPDKTRWTFSYDAEGRLITAGFAGPGQTALTSTFAYNHSDQVTAYTNSRGKTWTFTYNAARRLTQSTSPTGDKVTYTYDAAGNVTREEYSNGTGPVTFWQGTDFDGLNRVLRSIGAMGQEWDYSHDREDNLATLTDPLNHTTTHAYDPLNRLISTVDRENHTTGMEYDAHDRLTEYTDPRAIETDFTYNGFGEVITEVSADRGTISYTYDRRGLVKTRTDGRGITTTYSYDNAGRLTLIDYPPGGIGDIAFTYDTPLLGVPADANKGHTARINDGTIRMDFGHVVTATGPRVTMTATYPAARSYTVVEETDFEGNPTRTVYPSGKEILYTVDDANRITSIRLKNGATTTSLLTQMTYTPNGPLKSALYGDGYTQTRTYDLSYRLTGIKDALGATRLRDVTLGYEGRDNLTSITDLASPTPPAKASRARPAPMARSPTPMTASATA